MHRGFVKLYRKAVDGGMLKNHKLWAFWTWCLLKANYKEEYETMVGLQKVTLKPGEFVFGRRKAAEETGLTEQEVRSILSSLRRNKKLTIKSTNKFSVVSITKWDTYQGGYCRDQPADQPATNQQVTTNKNIKNIKNTVLEIISSFLEKYENPEVIMETLEAISSSRKRGPISDAEKQKILQSMEKYPAAQVLDGCKVYLDKGYHQKGKGEAYLMGVIRNQNHVSAKDENHKTSGSKLFDDYTRGDISPVPRMSDDRYSN